MSNPFHQFMSLAIALAKQGRFTVSPNPMVGCVIVKNNRIVGQGFHQFAGGPHAEIVALQEAGLNAKNATAYVSLEPCCHFNRTPPCTHALIAAGIKKVIVACLDPNPKVSGKGILQLRLAGISVEIGLQEQEAIQLNEIFFHYMKHQRPFVIAKWAMSLDGKTITHQHDSRNISSHQSQIASHHIRQQVDAILIGSKTAIHDDPQLTIRHFQVEPAKQPVRIILSSNGILPTHLKLLNDGLAKTIVATTDAMMETTYKSLNKKNIETLIVKQNAKGQVDLPSLLQILARREITSLLVEGGTETHNSFFYENLINRVHVYLAPVIIAGLQQKKLLKNTSLSTIDCDYFINADLGE